jgi:hypothetical protein
MYSMVTPGARPIQEICNELQLEVTLLENRYLKIDSKW